MDRDGWIYIYILSLSRSKLLNRLRTQIETTPHLFLISSSDNTVNFNFKQVYLIIVNRTKEHFTLIKTSDTTPPRMCILCQVYRNTQNGLTTTNLCMAYRYKDLSCAWLEHASANTYMQVPRQVHISHFPTTEPIRHQI